MNRVKGEEFHRESLEGVDAVLKRMVEALGNPPVGSYAQVLDVSENTIKTWKRRGGVPLRYLEGFSREHKVALDYLLRGSVHVEPVAEGEVPQVPCAKDERSSYGQPKTTTSQINVELLRQIIEAVEGALEKKKRSISTDKKAELIALIYEHFQQEGRTDDAVVQRFLKLVA